MDFACGNIFIRRDGPFGRGQMVNGHKHNFDHATFVTLGAFRISRGEGIEEESKIVRAGDLPILIKAGIEHTLIAIEDGSSYSCIYAHRTPQGEVVQEYTGWRDAYI